MYGQVRICVGHARMGDEQTNAGQEQGYLVQTGEEDRIVPNADERKVHA
jgi:hypothetical protein